MQMIQINGNALHVQHIPGPSQAAALVFLHEGLGSISMWRDWPAQVCTATARPAWVYSRLGYGQSSPLVDVRGAGRLKPDYMHEQAFDVLPGLLARLGVRQPPVLIGHSDGATIALLYASRYEVSACIAMAAHLFVEDISLQAIQAARTAYVQGPLRERLARHHADVESAFWQWNDAWLNPQFHSFDIRAQCRQIRAPVLAMQGIDDEYGSLEQLHEISRAVPHAQTMVLNNCGHSPQRDQPALITQVIAQFLQNCP